MPLLVAHTIMLEISSHGSLYNGLLVKVMYQVPMSFPLFVLILPLLQLNPVAPSVRISCLSDIIQDYWNFVLVKDNTVCSLSDYGILLY